MKYDIAAYIWPSYTGTEPRSIIFWDEGIGEWQTVRKAGGPQPLWGYEDEADPKVMEKQIDAAVSHGVNVFIYDWYWYDGRPFLEQCLDNGFLKASNRSKMKFYLMWANHDAGMTWDRRNSEMEDVVVWQGKVDKPNFETVVHRVIENYFGLPEYYKIDGKPVFMIYDVANIIKSFGTVEDARKALDWFREETVKAGYPGLELQMTYWSEFAINLSGVDSNHTGNAFEALSMLGFDSISHYQFVHFTPLYEDWTYEAVLELLQKEWEKIDSHGITYYPHVSIGWDNNPRFLERRRHVITNNTPENFEKGLLLAKEYLEKKHPERTKLITINSWNEWTESSELEPSDTLGFGYLEAIKKVFGTYN